MADCTIPVVFVHTTYRDCPHPDLGEYCTGQPDYASEEAERAALCQYRVQSRPLKLKASVQTENIQQQPD